MPLGAPTDRQIGALQTCGRLERCRAGAENRSLGVAREVRPVSGRWDRVRGSRRGQTRAIDDCLEFSAYACKREQTLCQLLRLLDDLPYPVCSRAFKRFTPRSLPASIQLPPGVLPAAIVSVGMLESGSSDTRLLLTGTLQPSQALLTCVCRHRS